MSVRQGVFVGMAAGRHAAAQDDGEHRLDRSWSPQQPTPENALQESFVYALGRVERRFARSGAENEMRWVLMVRGVEAFVLAPRSRADLGLLIQCARDVPDVADVDVVIGLQRPVAPSGGREGPTIPTVVFDHLFRLGRAELAHAILTDVRRCAAVAETETCP